MGSGPSSSKSFGDEGGEEEGVAIRFLSGAFYYEKKRLIILNYELQFDMICLAV